MIINHVKNPPRLSLYLRSTVRMWWRLGTGRSSTWSGRGATASWWRSSWWPATQTWRMERGRKVRVFLVVERVSHSAETAGDEPMTETLWARLAKLYPTFCSPPPPSSKTTWGQRQGRFTSQTGSQVSQGELRGNLLWRWSSAPRLNRSSFH